MLVGCGLILANEVHGEYGSAALLPPEVRDVAAIGFAVAVLVKSAQLPFSGWLPRAMEGPTPSSALFYGGLSLHVGLLLAVRLHSLWVTSPLAQWMFIVCGGLTAIDAGIRSRVQPDAKTALAWSAMSTMGVMVAMIGVGLWAWVVPLVAGHAVIRWYQLIRSPSQPMDLLWYRKSMGLSLGRVAQTPVAVHAWLLARKLFQVPSEMVGRSLQACRAACRALFPSKVRILSSLLPLFVALAYAWTLSDSQVGMILTIGSGLMVLVMALAPFHVPENRPMLTGAAGACAIAMTGALMASDHDFNSTVLFSGGIVITLSAVISVLGSDDLADVLSATLKGSTGMALLVQSYGHGIAMGAAVFLALTGILATWLLSSVVARLGPVDWSRLGGVARLAPRFHAGFLLLMGALIGMPPWVSFMLVDGAMESASAFSPWMCLVLAGFWAVVAFRVGRLTMECCWGPPRGLVSDGPIPDLLDREWIPVLAVTLLLGATGLVQSLGITRESWWSPTSPATSGLMKYDQKAMDSLFNFSGFTGCGAPQNMPGCAQSGMGVTPVALCGTSLRWMITMIKPQVSGVSTAGRDWVADLTAGVVVFLVALPLCLGIAFASNAPLISGVLAGIVGGIVVGLISGSHSSVSGPAAGLTAVVAAQIHSVGSFEGFLLAVMFAGFLQIILGVSRCGFVAKVMPSSVIQGLLAAIGIILIMK